MQSCQIIRIENEGMFRRYEAGIRKLLFIYKDILLDDFCDPNPECLIENTATYLPWLWLAVNQDDEVFALCCLTDVIPGRHVFIHGVSHPKIRRHPVITEISKNAIRLAFEHLGVHKVKAEIEASNLGARGFCLRMGFVPEGRFHQDNRVGGQWEDVLVYSLFREKFFSRKKEIYQ